MTAPSPFSSEKSEIESARSGHAICGLKSDVSHRPTLHEIHEEHLAHDPQYFWALKDINLSVRTGEVVGIIGRNGAGKSTLLKILSRITPPTTGKITYNGRIASLLEVGTGFHRELTGRENIYLNGSILGMKRAEIAKKFDEIVAFAEVEKFIDTPVKFYSSGMYVRLAFAVAANLEPEILLVDEVLAVGDVAFQKKCLGRLGQVANSGRTVIFVSHNMPAIRSLCQRALLLAGGRAVFNGTAESTIAKYLNSSSAEIPTTVTLPTADHDTPVRPRSLRFLALDNTPKSQFLIGEAWRIMLEFDVLKPIQHFIAALGVITSDSVSVTTFWSNPHDLNQGSYCVEFVVTLPLSACDLEFVVGLSSFERTFYYAQQLGHVSITEIAAEGQPVRARGTGLLVAQERPNIRTLPAAQLTGDKR